MDRLDRLMDAAARPVGAPQPDRLDALMDSHQTRNDPAFRAGVLQGAGANPDEEARQRRIAELLGRPVEVVKALPQQSAIDATLATLEQQTAGSPVLRRTFSEVDFAKLAHDDATSLSGIERALSAVKGAARYIASAPDEKNTLLGDLGAGVYRMNRGAAGVFQAGAEFFAPLLDPLAGRVLPENPLRRVASGFAQMGRQSEEAAKRLSPPQQDIVGGGVSSGVQSLAQNVATIPLALINPLAGLLAMGATTGGGAYQDAREKNITPAGALPYAATQGVIEAATEKIPMQRLLGDIARNASVGRILTRQIAAEVPGEQVATVLQDMNDWAILNPSKTFGEYLAERPAAAAQTLIATIVGVGGNVALGKMLDPVIAGAQDRAERAREADANAQLLAQIGQYAAASKVLERDPATVEGFVAQVAEETGVDTVFVDAQVLMQSGLAEQAAAALPSVAEQLPTALQTGSTIAIPVAEYVARVAGTPLNGPLAETVRFDPNGFSRAEAQVYMQTQAAELQAEVERALGEREGLDEFRASQERVRQTVLGELNALGRFRPEKNEVDATLIAARTAVRAAQLGMTPEQLFAQQALRVRAQGMADAQALTQGRTVRLYHGGNAGLTEIEGGVGPGNIFGGIFATPSRSAAATHGDGSLYSIDLPEDRILTQDVLNRLDPGQVKATLKQSMPRLRDEDFDVAFEAVVEDRSHTLDPDDMVRVFRKDTEGEASWEAQRIRGEVARRLGYQAVAMSDEYGTSYLVVPGAQVTPATDELFQPVSTRVPTAKGRGKNPPPVENPLADRLQIGLETFRGVPQAFESAVRLLTSYVNWRPNSALRGPDKRAEKFINDVVQNLLWLHDQVPPEIRERSKKWYDGANVIANMLAERYGLTLSQTSAVLAVNSPQTEWFTNVSRAERILDIWFNQQNTAWSAEMNATADRILGSPKYATELAAIRGKTLAELDGQPVLQAMWLRVFDESHNPRVFRLVTPEGTFGELVRTDSGAPATLAWANFDHIAKSIEIIKDASLANVSARLGQAHKVRSFYNNIFAPNDPVGDVTIDTHAVAAALLRPLSGSDTEVEHNLGAGVSNALKGISGTYGIYAEAYRRAAALRGLLPREMQSITWEAVRGMYTDVFKRSAQAHQVTEVWRRYSRGESNESDVRETIKGLAGGINEPDWWQSDRRPPTETWTSSYGGELSQLRVPGRDAAAPAGGDPAGSAGGGRGSQGSDLAELNQPAPAGARGSIAFDVYEAFGPEGKSLGFVQAPDRATAQRMAAQRFPSMESVGEQPASLMTLLRGADLSTFLHETGHYFLEMDLALAADLVGREQLTEGEQQILTDVSTLLTYVGITGPVAEQVITWYNLPFEEKRTYHEKVAESFEAYLFEGRAPSIELEGVFQKFRAWLLNVYQSLKDFIARNPAAGDLTPEVREVFDRMLATTDQIELAEKARSMFPLFTAADQAGMTVAEFAAYQNLGTQASQDAIQELQGRVLRDLAWQRRAHGREVKRLQKVAAERRREARIEARSQVLSQPVYQAWQFLTGRMTADDKLSEDKRKSDPNVVDPTQDSLFAAIAKLGGIKRDQANSRWGLDDKTIASIGQPVFGKPVLRREGGLDLDEMGEQLVGYGYLAPEAIYADGVNVARHDIHEFEAAFDSELRGKPVYAAAKDYSEEAMPGAQVTRENVAAGRIDLYSLKQMVPAEIAEHLQNLGMTAKRGIHPDILSEMFVNADGGYAFTSGEDLVRQLAAAMPINEEIEGLTDRIMLERHGDLATPAAIDRAADKVIHNEARARMVAAEANALARALNARQQTGTTAGGRPVTRAVLPDAARAMAQQMVARLKIRDIRPGRYSSAQARAAREAAKAQAAGKLEIALGEKRNELIQTYAARAAHDAQDEVDRAVRYLRKFNREGTRRGMPPDYLAQIDALLERFDLRDLSLKAIDRKLSLRAWLDEQRSQGLEPNIPPELEEEVGRENYRNLTLEQFRGLVDTVRQIEHLGRTKKRLLTARDRREWDAIRGEITQSIEDNAGDRRADTRTPTTWLGNKLLGLRKFYAAHLRAGTLARVLDGGKDGPVWEYLIEPANAAGDREVTMRAEASQQLAEILAPVMKLGSMGGKGMPFASIGRSLNRQQRIAIALNTGNASNLQRLLGGEGWTVDQIRPVLESLTTVEWQAVQAIWDFMESYRPLIGAKEMRVYGKEPEWVEAVPFEVRTADGQQLTLRGGYYPIKYDPLASIRAEEHSDAEDARRQLQGAYTSATTRRSFTKSRADEVQGRPLLYDLSGVFSGVNDVIHDLCWHEWLIDANRILRSQSIDSAIRTHYGPEIKEQFKTWVADVAEGERGAADAGERAAAWLRQSISAAGLGFNVMSALLQPLGLTQSIVRIGPRHAAKGIAQFLSAPREAAREVVEKSEFMRNRSRTRLREIAEVRNRVEGETAAGAAVRNSAYYMMLRMQQLVDYPTWLGAYERATNEGVDEERAIRLADQAVIDAQGSGQHKDLSKLQRGTALQKLFTVFYDYMGTTFNLAVAQTMTQKSRGRLAADYLLLFTVPVLLTHALKEALKPGGDEDDDWEDIARKLIAEQASYMLGLMVYVRELGDIGTILFGAEGATREYRGPAGLRLFGDTFSFAKQASQGEFDDAFRKAAINILGDLTGLPAAQINKTITGAKALAEGETENPAAIIMGYDRP